MYEPKNKPVVNRAPLDISGIKYGAVYVKETNGPGHPHSDPLHIHGYTEIIYNVNCNMSFAVRDTIYRVRPGEAVAVEPNVVHVGVFDRVEVQEHICLWIDADVDSPLFDFMHRDNFRHLMSFDEATSLRVRELLTSLAKMNGEDERVLESTACLLQLFTIFNSHNDTGERRAEFSEEMQRIVSDINENFSQIHSVNQLMERHFVSSATITRWFKKYLSVTPKEYLESQRLAHAMRLLDSGESVTAAACASGFSDISHFITLFKKRFGKTPFKYKKYK